MSLVFVLALLGLLVAGARGVLLGALIGVVLTWLQRGALLKRLATVRAQFLESTFAVMGALCKADGVVTRDEIATAEALFRRLQLSSEQREQAKAAFRRGKAPDFDLEGEIRRFVTVCRGQRLLKIMFLQIQLSAIAGDGNVHPAEHEMLVRIARLLGLSEVDVAQLEALLRAASATSAGQRARARSSLDDAYAALGLTPSATDAEIKRAYRRLMSQNHPDKLAGKGLPESMRQLAEERAREINAAYEMIKEARGFT
ncbi:MAG: co-chaperone DjlA [Gammaproteobacteria bacterium]|nr:co-chaperone DjlA [Gammaproteobacteria bacterium]